MAFPTGYTKYQEVTIDATKVDADLTDYVIYVNLADLSKAGADIFDTCRTDGGDIRVTKNDGTTELPREVVAIDTTAKTGELHIKYSGTLSGSTNTTIRIWYNGSDTEPAVTATYGRNNVWSAYKAVLHMQQDPSTTAQTDSTGNGNSGASVGSMTSGDSVAGKVGKCLEFDGSNDGITLTDSATLGDVFDSYTTAWTMQFWWKAISGSKPVIDKWSGSVGWLFGNEATYLCAQPRNSAAFEDRIRGSVYSVVDNAWHAAVYENTTSTARNDFKFFVDGQQDTTTGTDDELTTETISNSSDLKFMSTANLGVTAGFVDEIRISLGNLASTWLSTEYNNQNSPSTFYSTGNEQSSVVASTHRGMFALLEKA